MRGWRLGLVAVAVAVAVIVAGATTGGEAAVVFPFDGHGTSSGAAAPAPLQWDVVANLPVGGDIADFWLLSLQLWPSSTSVTDFHVTFTERTISDVTGGAGTGMGHVDSAAGFVEWSRIITNGQDSSSVDFFAPSGVSLDQGEQFLVVVRWVTDASAVRDFNAHWTTDAAVPEPATLMLLGTGLVALAAVRRRRV